MPQLEARLRALEDHEAIRRLIAAYGPLADAGDGSGLANLFTADGEYDVGDWGVLRGRDELLRIVDNPVHQGWMEQGVAHALSAPRILLSGDQATATNHSLVLLRQADQTWHTVRAAANRWELVRNPEGAWKIARRINRLLDGSAAARALLLL